MENASKALLIAAAVLIVILLIAFGVNVFNSSQSAGDADGTAQALSNKVDSATESIKGSLDLITF